MTLEQIISGIKQKPFYRDSSVVIYNADCRDILPQISDHCVDLCLTDPPYPSQHLEYGDSDISFLKTLHCQQLVFWSARDMFPLPFTAKHIWDKQIGTATQYEEIYEINGGKDWRVFSFYRMNNALSAKWVNDNYTGHPSQKPQRLIAFLIEELSPNANLILDPFLGSGTTAYCAKKLGRKCIGIEIEEKYCRIAARRCAQEILPLDVPVTYPEKQESMI